MNYIDSDLEEGEIPDDSPSSSHATDKKVRELPRRYILRENKSPHKHKKDCKHAIRYHAKKLAKLKKTPMRDAYKKHRKSCPHNTKYDNPVSEHFSKNGLSFSKHSLIAEMNCALKGISLKKQYSVPSRSNPQIFPSDTKNKATNDNLNKFESSENIKNSESQLKSTNDSLSDSKQHKQLVEKSDDLPHLKELDSNTEIKDAPAVISECPKGESEESEDEEELRRIALATCAKRKLVREASENLSQNVSSNIVVVPKSPEINAQVLPDVTSNLVSDNYEVVDMEVDEESENSGDNVDNENLFVIDTQPSSTLDENVGSPASHTENSSDVDFEAAILRAELIGSMVHKRAVSQEQLKNQKSNTTKCPKQMSVTQESKISATYQKPNINLLCHKPLQSAKRILRKNGVNKSLKLKRNSGRLAHNNQVNKSPKRLIITLKAESSSEESDDEVDLNLVPENPVASIEALISDCRQKSDSNEKIDEVVKNVPKALSCLSKAQQEEYNSLLKILAKKEKLPISQATFHRNSEAIRSPLDDLKLLEVKLLHLEEALNKKKLTMTNISKDVNEKKQMYMKSKLSAQHLKEQYVAAEKVRRIKLDEWSKSCHNFEVVKKSISGLESKIIQLHHFCSKLGSSVQGLTYNFPSLSTHNGQM